MYITRLFPDSWQILDLGSNPARNLYADQLFLTPSPALARSSICSPIVGGLILWLHYSMEAAANITFSQSFRYIRGSLPASPLSNCRRRAGPGKGDNSSCTGLASSVERSRRSRKYTPFPPLRWHPLVPARILHPPVYPSWLWGSPKCRSETTPCGNQDGSGWNMSLSEIARTCLWEPWNTINREVAPSQSWPLE